MKYLWLERGADPYKQGPKHANLLQLVAISNEPEAVRFVMKQKRKIQGNQLVPFFDPNAPCPYEKNTALQFAIFNKKFKIIPTLVQYGCDPKLLNDSKRNLISTLLKIIHPIDLQMFEALFETGLGPTEYISSRGYTLIEELIAIDDMPSLRYFIQHQNPLYRFPYINNNGEYYMNKQNGLTLLHTAVLYNAKNCIDFILRTNIIPIDVLSQNEQTPFQYAVLIDKLQTAEMLVTQKNAKPYISSPTLGYNVLHFAATIKDIKQSTLQWIIKKFPQLLESRDKSLATPLSIAFQYGNFNTIKILQQLGADFTTKGLGNTNLYHSVAKSTQNNFHTLIEYLSKQLPSINLRDTAADDGTTPLVTACKYGIATTIKYLITTKDLPVDIKTDNGWDLLFWVILSDNTDAIRFILNLRMKNNKEQPQFQPNTINIKTGYNALHFAVLYGKSNAVKLLIQFKADPLIKTEKGETIIDLMKNLDYSNSIPDEIKRDEFITLCKQMYENERKLHLNAEDLDNDLD